MPAYPFIKRGDLPSQLTTYDLVKCLALALMLVDHVGFFFYPEELWLRAVGRACLPIWFFLIGYATSRDLGPRLWLGGLALIAANIVCGGNVLPLNVLFTIIAIRLVIDRTAEVMFRGWEVMIYILFLLAMLFYPSMILSEYGTSGLLLALFGYVRRHGDTLAMPKFVQRVFCAYTVFFFVLSQVVLFHLAAPDFDGPEARLTALLAGLTAMLMYVFKPLALPAATEKLPRAVTWALQIGGRYTLEIYVVHLIAFKIAAAALGLERYGWFAFDWVR